MVSGEFSKGYSGLKNGVDFWDSKTSPGHVTLDVTLTAENSGIQNGGEINLDVEDKLQSPGYSAGFRSRSCLLVR